MPSETVAGMMAGEGLLPLRSACTCQCHVIGGIHFRACCRPDPTIPATVAGGEQVERFVAPLPAEMMLAARIVDSPSVISAYASCEWDDLHDDGKVWIAAIIRAALAAAPEPPKANDPAASPATPSGDDRALVEALRPFARYADAVLKRRDGAELEPVPDDRLVFGIDGRHISIGDLRRARGALERAER